MKEEMSQKIPQIYKGLLVTIKDTWFIPTQKTWNNG